jgi:hypothetical protein
LDNKGIWVAGDFIAGTGNVAVGEGATINVSGQGQIFDSGIAAEVRAKLDQIVRLLEAHRDDILDPDVLLDAARAATDETRKHEPRKEVILARLRHIATGVGTTVDLATAVVPLVDAAVKLLH